MLIEVTKNDIATGRPDDTCRCPVALALQRAFQCTEREVYVDAKIIRIVGLSYPAPKSVGDFVELFDAARPEDDPQPFSFELPDASR